MKSKNVFVVGQGSIGKRHIQNLLLLNQEISVFSYRKSMGQNYEHLKNVVYVDSLEEGIEKSDALVICNRTDQHIDIAINAAKSKKHILVEKPISNTLNKVNDLKKIVQQNRLVFNPGFMLRYHPNLLFIKELIRNKYIGDIYYVNTHVGQYLPDWRPESNYKNNYGAKKKWGGGVTLDLIHEIDLIHWFFGEVEHVSGMLGYTPKLDIETETISSINLKLKANIICNIELDYVSPILRRKMEIVGEKGIINWDFIEGCVTLSDKKVNKKVIHKLDNGFQRNDMFLDELKDFLNSIDNSYYQEDRLDSSIMALKTAICALESNEKKKFISPLDL